MSQTSRPAHTAVDGALEKLPQAALIDMINTYGKLYQKLDGLWYVSVMDRWGNEAALERDIRVWETAIGYEVRLLSEALGISGRTDIGSFLQVFRASPMTLITRYTIDADSGGNITMTTTACPILEALEREGQGREFSICQMVDRVIFGAYARHFGSDLAIEPVKLPPRQKNDVICCQWRLKTAQPPPAGLPFHGLDLKTVPVKTLRALVKAYCRLYQIVDGQWYLAVQAKWGNEAALERDMWVWERLPCIEIDHVTDMLRLKGRKDLDAFVEVFLNCPMNMTTDYQMERPDTGRAIVTFTFCPVLRALEKEGQGREKDICHDIDILIFASYARAFNPAIEVTPLFLPPRQGTEAVACRWEFRLKEA